MEKVIAPYTYTNVMSEQKRHPIQLKTRVKEKWDKLHEDLGKETNSETAEILVDFYRSKGMKVQV